MTSAIKTQGTVLARSVGGSPDTYSAVAEIKSIGINMSVPEIDATNFDSTFAERVVGIPDVGKISLSCNFLVAGGQNDVRDDFNSGVLRSYQITLADSAGTKIRFSAYVTAVGITMEKNGIIEGTFELSVSGAIEGV